MRGKAKGEKPDEETHHLREQRPIDPTGQNKTQDNSTFEKKVCGEKVGQHSYPILRRGPWC